MKKYELTNETKIIGNLTLHRIKALKDFGDIKTGDLGGWIEKEDNLSQEGCCWISGNAKVSGSARVYGNAWVSDSARVYGDAEVSGNAWVSDSAMVSGSARVYGNAWISGSADIYSKADYTTIKGFGSCFRTTTFFRCKDKLIRVKCGCFYGTIDEFREQVNNTRDGKIAKEYLMIADLMEYHFSKNEEE